MDRATGKLVAVSSMLGQLLTSAEIEKVRGPFDPEFDAEEDAAREMYPRPTSDGWQACMHGFQSRRRAVTDFRWTLSLIVDTIRT